MRQEKLFHWEMQKYLKVTRGYAFDELLNYISSIVYQLLLSFCVGGHVRN